LASRVAAVLQMMGGRIRVGAVWESRGQPGLAISVRIIAVYTRQGRRRIAGKTDIFGAMVWVRSRMRMTGSSPLHIAGALA
jgi:hypothetical protein